MGQAWRQIGKAIKYAEPGRCTRGAQLAAGVGLGLTPAGDDFLMGVMLALWLSMKEPDPYINALLAGARGRTGRLSTAFLEAAARGEAGQSWHHMAQAIAMADAQEIRQATAILLSAGHTSGADALLGFAGALESTGQAIDFHRTLVSS
jgi:hypothetical protein